jgi:hypothetical protein
MGVQIEYKNKRSCYIYGRSVHCAAAPLRLRGVGPSSVMSPIHVNPAVYGGKPVIDDRKHSVTSKLGTWSSVATILDAGNTNKTTKENEQCVNNNGGRTSDRRITAS